MQTVGRRIGGGGALLVGALALAGCALAGAGGPGSTGGPGGGPGAAAGEGGSVPAESVATEAPGALPAREPYLRVGLAVGPDSVLASAPGGLRVRDLATGREVATGRGGEGEWRLFPGPGGGITAVAGDTVRGERQDLLLEPRAGSTVRIDGRPYRGGAEVLAVPGRGIVLINRVPLEAYLRGVVPLEIGPRGPAELEAVKAQAVAARTYALANLGRRDSLGFDVFGTVEDQVYGGADVERPEADTAVRATAGEILTWRGRPIRAYYSADGGGHTAAVHEVWNLPDAPYLRSVPDRRPDGSDWGDADPNHDWEESWTGRELRSSLARGLADYYGIDTLRLGRVDSIRVMGRTESGRAARLEVRTDGGRFLVERNDIRFALRRPDGRVLRSTLFDVVAGPPEGGGLTLRGRGNGHGVGMCQWGALGRARAGQGYRAILDAYYPGAELRRTYGAPPGDGEPGRS